MGTSDRGTVSGKASFALADQLNSASAADPPDPFADLPLASEPVMEPEP